MAVDKLVDSTQLDADLTSVANAIRTKGGTSSQLEFPDEFVSAIQNIPGGGDPNPTAEDNDVIFIDYDGTIRYGYTTAEFLALTELPANPVQRGLIAQGWNWTLADAKSFVTKYDRLVIGQNYITDDGKTRLYLTVPEGHLDVTVTFIQTVSEGVLVDFGDGTQGVREIGANTMVNCVHTFANTGNYVITLLPDEGCALKLGYSSAYSLITPYSDEGNNYYSKMLTKIEVGIRCSEICSYGCRNIGVETISIPRTLTGYGPSAFQSTFLNALVIPPGVESAAGNLANSTRLRYISVPKGFKQYDGLANQCMQLMRLDVMDGVTEINGFVSTDYCLHPTIIIPDTVTAISGHRNFQKCFGLKSIHFKPSIPPTLNLGTNFEGLPTDCIIYVPTGKLNDYKTATNYPDPSVYTYMEE